MKRASVLVIDLSHISRGTVESVQSGMDRVIAETVQVLCHKSMVGVLAFPKGVPTMIPGRLYLRISKKIGQDWQVVSKGNQTKTIWSALCKILPYTLLYLASATTLMLLTILRILLKFHHYQPVPAAQVTSPLFQLYKLCLFDKVYVYCHGIQPILNPSLFPDGYASKSKDRYLRLLKAGTLFVFNSGYTKRTFCDHFKDQLKEPFSAPIIHPGVTEFADSPAPSTISSLPKCIDSGFLLFVGSLERRKNLSFMIKAWSSTASRLGRPPPLVVVGSVPKNSPSISAELLHRSPQFTDRLIMFGSASDKELSWFLRNARVLAFPSTAEGFGVPIREALSVGCPVISSYLPPHGEGIQYGATYLDPLNQESWRDEIVSFFDGTLIIKMPPQRFPNWSDHCDALQSHIS